MGRYDEARAMLELIASDEVAVNAGHQLRAHLTMMNVAFGLGDQSLANAWLGGPSCSPHQQRFLFQGRQSHL